MKAMVEVKEKQNKFELWADTIVSQLESSLKKEFNLEQWAAYNAALPIKECLEHPDESIFCNFVFVPEILRLYDLYFLSLENFCIGLDYSLLMNECVDAAGDYFLSKIRNFRRLIV